MPEFPEFQLKINGFTPDTLPMERLAEYMAAFSRLLGNANSVHFVRMENASAGLVSRVSERDEPKVIKRLELVKMNGGPAEARAAYQKIDDMLVEDATDATLLRNTSNLIVFPGKARTVPIIYNPVIQEDSVDGILISLGGKDETVPVHLSDGSNTYKCNTTKARAREMAPYIFGPILRVHGEANWRRDESGTWRLNNLIIKDFWPLNADSASEVIRRLRAIPGNSWDEVANPYELLSELRGDEEGK